MAKKTTTTKQNHTEPSWFAALKTFFTNERTRFITGLIISILTIYVGLALISFFFTGAADQSKIENVPLGDLLTNRGSVENWTGVRGAYLSDLLMNRWFGISSFMILFFLGSVGAKLMNLNKVSFWEKPGDKSDFPKWQYDWNTYLWGGRYVDRRVEKVNWLKIKTVSIGYTLPKAWMQKCGLDELRIFASGENLYTFTNYSGIEPEIVDIRNGEDVGSSYPLARKLTLGLTLKF